MRERRESGRGGSREIYRKDSMGESEYYCTAVCTMETHVYITILNAVTNAFIYM